jgi:3-methyladenine DNA glycosylase AlkD
MDVNPVLEDLKELGSASTKKTLLNHGAKEPIYGVKVEDLKKLIKKYKVKKDHELADALFRSGVSDAMYMAGLIADEAKMSKKDLQYWVEHAKWHMISEYTVPWIAAEGPHGWEMALKWIDDSREIVASAGWCTLSSLVALKSDEDLDIPALKKLLARVVKDIHHAPNRVRYTMNGFLIALGGYVAALTGDALKAGEKIGEVHVEMGGTACKVPSIPDYIAKMEARGVIGKKKKTVRC